ncbi:MAG: CIA30 family protein [Chloroflexi bacterium]|nr:CIA30 family protein [Chloroflexota bacterium]
MADDVLFDFAASGKTGRWRITNDGVMGGRSSSTFLLEGGHAIFTGMVSLENNGGFASVQSEPEVMDLSAFDGIEVRLKGDGKIYGVFLRTEPTWSPLRYDLRVETQADTWLKVSIPFDAFEARMFGTKVPAPALNPQMLRSVGFIISDKQEGAFRLEIDHVKAVEKIEDDE